MDEFVQLGWAKYLSNGLFETIWPVKAVGYALFYKLAHLIGWDATSVLLAGRVQTALLACAILGMSYACARRIGESPLRSLLLVLVLLSFSNFTERVFRTIAEPLALFFAVAALLVVLNGRPERARTLIAAGVLSGLAFVSTQKSIYFNLALGAALLTDAALARRYAEGIARGAWLVLGWFVPVVIYCLAFGGGEALRVAENLFFGPVEVATSVAADYPGLRQYVLQTLSRNALLYAFCIAGIVVEFARIRKLEAGRRIALAFTIVITALVFTHDQPWPYVFIMALPFISWWALAPFDRLAAGRFRVTAAAVLALAIALSFVRNAHYLQFGNGDQLRLVARAEALLARDELYFDGVGMLPNRAEPSTLWLDRHAVLETLREGQESEAYRIFATAPPEIILWSYRMEHIHPVVRPLIDNSYVKVAPNIRVAGRQLALGQPALFHVPVAGKYALYSEEGRRLSRPFELPRGKIQVTLRSGATTALLLPVGSYAGIISPGPDDDELFAHVYD